MEHIPKRHENIEWYTCLFLKTTKKQIFKAIIGA